jgi:hypothetical protein
LEAGGTVEILVQQGCGEWFVKTDVDAVEFDDIKNGIFLIVEAVYYSGRQNRCFAASATH